MVATLAIECVYVYKEMVPHYSRGQFLHFYGLGTLVLSPSE